MQRKRNLITQLSLINKSKNYMKRLFVIPLTMALLMGNGNAHAQNTPVSQMEKLNRGLVVLPSQSGAGDRKSVV